MSITGIYTCPDCKLPVTTRTAAANVIVCPHCFAPIKRMTDGHLQERINLLVTREDSTPIQTGTSGEWKGRKFEIIGRVRAVFVEGFTNYWTMLFEEGDILMLAESFGQFAVYEKTVLDIDVSIPMLSRMDYGGETRELNYKKYYTLERQRFCQYMEVEGEALLFDEDGKFFLLEMAAQGGGRLALAGNQGKVDYISFRSHCQPFDDFKFENLRSQEAGIVRKEITCTSCNNTVPLYSWPLAQSATCTTCGACYTFEKGAWKYKRRTKVEKAPVIPLHARGTIRGTEYQVVGYMEKEDDESFQWREYTLYNPVYGYTFLSEYNGHWIFLKEMADAPVIVSHRTMAYYYDGKTFKIFNRYRYKLVDCRGEFPGDVFDNKKPDCKEFIAPPEIWVRETHEWGMCWYHGTHIPSKELYAAFTNISLPYTIGVGSVQPAPGQVDPTVLRNTLLGAGALFLLLFLFSMLFNQEKVLYDNTISLPDSTTLPPVITPPFKLDKWRSNLQFDISAPVGNNWFEAGITLVNADNGNEYTVEKGIEKYSGYEDGESWTEGSDHDDAIMHSIPAGNYFLQIYPARADNTVTSFSLRVTYDVPMWRNFFIFVLFALLPLAGLYINIYIKESMRWQNSPYTHNANNND
jgi:hypothetical protein